MRKIHIQLNLFFVLFILQGVILGQAFQPKVDFGGASQPFNIIAVDLNGDGIKDAAIANLGTSSVSVFVNITSPSDSLPRYGKRQDFTTGLASSGVASADFNMDGLNDLAVVGSIGNIVSVLLNTTNIGDTTVAFASQTDLVTGSTPYAITAADFNLDGIPDLVVTNSADNSVSVFLNTTAPGAAGISFSAKTDFTSGSAPYAIIADDFNGDYISDIAITNFGDNTISIFINGTAPGGATPNFSAKQDFATGKGPASIAAADIDGNGTLDFAVANKSDNSFSLLKNTTAPGNSTLSLSAKVDSSTGGTPTSILLRDISGDSKVDVIVTNAADSSVSVFLNSAFPGSPNFQFSASKSFATGTGPASVAVVDINRDGRGDLITANAADSSFSAMFNDTYTFLQNMALSGKFVYSTHGNSSAIASGDLNGDGRPDLAVSNWDSSSVSVFMNTTPFGAEIPYFSARADYKIVDTGSDVEIGDINNDGKPDLVVTNWADSVSVLINKTKLGDSSSAFMKPVNFNTGFQAGPNAVAIGDLNSDGKSDLVFANQFPDVNNIFHVAVLFNITPAGDSIPRFAKYSEQITGEGPQDVVIADFNRDLIQDFAIADFTSGTIIVFLNTTKPGDTTAVISAKFDFVTGQGTMGIDAADLNGDGNIDIAVANQNGDNIATMMNTTPIGSSTPTFANKVTYSGEFGPNSMNIHDIDGDGKPELIVTNSSAKNVFSIFFNGWSIENFEPYFGDMTSYDAGELPISIAVADINGDGLKDFVTADQNGNTISVRLNSSIFVEVKNNSELQPEKFVLYQNYPNPFNPSTTIKYKMANFGKVSIKIYDLLGREVAKLVDEYKPSGEYSVNFDASKLSSGVYFYRVHSGNILQTRKMMLLK